VYLVNAVRLLDGSAKLFAPGGRGEAARFELLSHGRKHDIERLRSPAATNGRPSRKVAARIPTSEKLIEIDFRDGKPVKAGHR
jgi:hypothetical protein